MHKHVGALEGEISAMRAELQELRKEMLVGSDKGVIGKMGSSVSGGLGRASSMFFGQQERQHHREQQHRQGQWKLKRKSGACKSDTPKPEQPHHITSLLIVIVLVIEICT